MKRWIDDYDRKRRPYESQVIEENEGQHDSEGRLRLWSALSQPLQHETSVSIVVTNSIQVESKGQNEAILDTEISS